MVFMPSKPPTHRALGWKSRQERKADADRRRPTSAQRGYGRKWRTESAADLALPHNGRCRCGAVATMVDHIKAHKGDMRLFWDRANWQPSCFPCNSRKAVTSEGSFGRDVAS
jgi:5-methylcytosine-specific restriction endonuclease McrA